MTKREELCNAVWSAIDPSFEGVARECAEQAKAAIMTAPAGTFADEIAVLKTGDDDE